MKVIICGSRDWYDIMIIRRRLMKLQDQFPDAIIIEGGCDGADLVARRVAKSIGLDLVEFPANWTRYGKSAGPIRNIKMLDTKPQLVIAFHDDLENSKGTKHIVDEARKRRIEVEVIGSGMS